MASGNTLLVFSAEDGAPPSANFAAWTRRNNHIVAAFDAGTDESLDFRGVLPQRYGVDGTRYGDAGVSTPQGALLPWPNDARIRAEMCANTSRGLCSAPSVSEYLRAR